MTYKTARAPSSFGSWPPLYDDLCPAFVVDRRTDAVDVGLVPMHFMVVVRCPSDISTPHDVIPIERWLIFRLNPHLVHGS